MKSSRRGIIVLFCVLALSAILGGMYGPPGRASAASVNDAQDSLRSFTRVLSIVQRNYADPVDSEKAIYDGAIPGMLRVLDPHSNFFDPKQYALLREEQHGKYYGVGMTVGPRENHTVVLSPFVNSPAYKAGIRPGDIISKVNGKICDGLTTLEVADMLKGPKGTDVHIALVRQGWDSPIEVTVTRDEIPRPGVDYYSMIRPGIGYVRASSFNETTSDDLHEALQHLDFAHLDGLILDLRGNPGGLLNEAVGVADAFLDKNQLVVSHHGRASPERRYYAVNGNRSVIVPLVVLINGQSASASEIVAGAVQDHDRGLIVGETSFGKGLVQSQVILPEDTAMLLTTARYYTPSGRLVQRDYKNVSLYDYLYNHNSPKPTEVKLTDGGRQVFGGGGITPDVVVPAPKINAFQETLYRHMVFFPYEVYMPFNQMGVGDFTRSFLASKPDVPRDFAVNDAVIADFRHYLETSGIKFTDADIQDNLAWIKMKIHREVVTSVYGQNDGYRVELQDDPQLLKAIEEIPQAKALYDNARKILAEHQASTAPANPQ
ncbi:MAG: S41 family peptidase [Candidatus Acidiferrales bacterium]